MSDNINKLGPRSNLQKNLLTEIVCVPCSIVAIISQVFIYEIRPIESCVINLQVTLTSQSNYGQYNRNMLTYGKSIVKLDLVYTNQYVPMCTCIKAISFTRS